MQELSDFYEQNIDDPKVHFLEKLRLKLKAALMARLKQEDFEQRPQQFQRNGYSDDDLAVPEANSDLETS